MSPYRYQVLGPLQAGEGSRAQLGLAISPDSKARPVVVVWVPESAEQDPALLEMIQQETEHAAMLDHPNIVTVLGFAEIEQRYARVVEFADGESLRKILEVAQKLPTRFALRVILDCCTGVHYAHVAGNDDGSALVHGDVRPETVLVSFGGVTKVTGYGALAFAPREVGGQRVKGRRVHSAPEQVIGGRLAFAVPTDVYLLGILFYECLTGVVPWADQGEFFDHAVLTLPLPPPSPGDIPPELEPIIQKACAKKAADRYPTPLAMREAIEAVEGLDVASVEELSQYLDSLFPQSHELRAVRRQTIDAGIADFVRRQWADQDRRETVQMRATQVPAAAPVEPGAAAPPITQPPDPTPRPLPPVRPAPPPPRAPVWTQPEEDEEPRRDEGSNTPWLIALALFIAVIAGWWAWKKANEPIPGIDTLPPPPVAVIVDAGPPPEAAVAAAEPAAEDAGTAEAPTPVTETAPPVEAAPSTVQVSIDSTPSVELLLDGKSLGRTPWSGRLPPGRKVFTFQDKEQLLSTARAVTVRDEPVSERYTFEKGFVAVRAPEGSAIFIDGTRVGSAPIRGEIPVFEGSHRITVNIGKSKWSEPFNLYAGQRISFNVEMQ